MNDQAKWTAAVIKLTINDRAHPPQPMRRSTAGGTRPGGPAATPRAPRKRQFMAYLVGLICGLSLWSSAWGATPVIIDYMVLYTPAAAERVGGTAAMLDRITAGVTAVNTALAGSGL